MGKTIEEMKKKQSIEQLAMAMIFEELRKAEQKFPGFPVDVVHGASILAEEAGEVIKSALDYHYGRSGNQEDLRKEIAQTGAMAIRFLLRMLDSKHYPKQER